MKCREMFTKFREIEAKFWYVIFTADKNARAIFKIVRGIHANLLRTVMNMVELNNTVFNKFLFLKCIKFNLIFFLYKKIVF
jgi:hypothetical protein